MPKVSIPVNIPSWIHKPLRGVKRALAKPPVLPNIWGDREIEYSFIVAHMPAGPGRALDFGSGASYLTLVAARRGFEAVALDLEPQSFWWKHEGVRFVTADLLTVDMPNESLDLVTNCSAVEHVGLVGRYGVSEARMDGDLQVMERLRSLLKPGGMMLLTIPCGQDSVFVPTHRVYGEKRLPQLLNGYAIEKEEYWVKDSGNKWNVCDRKTALQFEPRPDFARPVDCSYALACFVLRKPHASSARPSI